MEKVLKLFGKRLYTLRKENKMTQEELALASDLSQQYIGAIEKGNKNPSLTTLNKIAAVFKIPLNQLLAIPETAGDDENYLLSLLGETNQKKKKEIVQALKLLLKK